VLLLVGAQQEVDIGRLSKSSSLYEQPAKAYYTSLSSEEITIAAIVVFMPLAAVCFIFIELREVKRLKNRH
jgi:p-aminobenzoyl-glutamate transporter AbgT